MRRSRGPIVAAAVALAAAGSGVALAATHPRPSRRSPRADRHFPEDGRFATGRGGLESHPVVTPGRGGPRTAFAVRFTLPVAAGHAGVVDTRYSLAVIAPRARSTARCAGSAAAAPATGAAGKRVRVRLIGPANGWCEGAYTVTVLLERGPYCPPASPTRPPVMCPEFLTAVRPVGSARFRVS
jgi:hypothetical protein